MFQIWPFYSLKLHFALTVPGKFLRQKLHRVVSPCLHLRIWALSGAICISLTNISILFSIVLLSNDSFLILTDAFWRQCFIQKKAVWPKCCFWSIGKCLQRSLEAGHTVGHLLHAQQFSGAERVSSLKRGKGMFICLQHPWIWLWILTWLLLKLSS